MAAVAILHSDPLSARGLREILTGLGLRVVDDPTDADVVAVTGDVPHVGSAPILMVSRRQHPAVLLLDLLVGRVAGIVLVDREVTHLKLAVDALARGELWVDPALVEELVVAAHRGTSWQGPAGLTSQEMRVLRLLDGRTNREIGHVLGLSAETVKTHVSNAVGKLAAFDRVHAVELARDRHLLD